MKQLFGDEKAKKNPMGKDKKYSRAIKIPQYEPKDEKPPVSDLYNTEKYNKLVAKINKAQLPDDVKKFLIFGASRHIVFNYSKIADYYAHADKKIQELMEESALVIIDMDDAIANGYVALTEKMKQLIDEEKERDKQAKEARRVLKEQRKLMEEKEKEEKAKGIKENNDETADTENEKKISE